jgi:stage V sporulation protein B
MSLVNMPVVITLAIAAAIVPSISAARVKKETDKINKSAALALKITMLVSIPCMLGLAVLARPIINLLYSGGLNSTTINEPLVAAQLLMMLAICVILIAFIQVITSILQGMNKNYKPVINLAIGAGVKVVASIILLPRIGIYGSAISTVLCFLTAFILNVITLARTLKLNLGFKDFFFAPITAGALMALAAYFSNALLSHVMHEKIAVIIAIAIAGLVFVVSAWLLGALTTEESSKIPLVRRLVRG